MRRLVSSWFTPKFGVRLRRSSQALCTTAAVSASLDSSSPLSSVTQRNLSEEKRILVTGFWDRYSERAKQQISERCPNWTVVCLKGDTEENNRKKFIEMLQSGEFDGALISWYDRGDQETLMAMREIDQGRLKVLSVISSGVDNVDLETCQRLGIAVTNVSPALSESCATYLLGLILMTVREIPAQRQDLRTGANKWIGQDGVFNIAAQCSQLDMQDLIVGIVGCGGIGCALAKRLQSFPNIRLIYHNRRRLDCEKESELSLMYEPSFETLIQTSDIVVCLCPLNSTTEGMFAAEQFRMMKKDAVFINGSRGRLCKTDDLVCALKNGDILAAGMDVVDPEPLPTDHELWTLRNCVVTPHAMSDSVPCQKDMFDCAVDSLIQLLLSDCEASLPTRVV